MVLQQPPHLCTVHILSSNSRIKLPFVYKGPVHISMYRLYIKFKFIQQDIVYISRYRPHIKPQFTYKVPCIHQGTVHISRYLSHIKVPFTYQTTYFTSVFLFQYSNNNKRNLLKKYDYQLKVFCNSNLL